MKCSLEFFQAVVFASFAIKIGKAKSGCKKMAFESRIEGKYLKDHVIGTFKVDKLSNCDVKCYMTDKCQSVNYDQRTGLCEMSATNRHMYPGDFINRTNCIYVGVKNKCFPSPCLFNGSCSPNFINNSFTCNCTGGYKGARCEIAPRIRLSLGSYGRVEVMKRGEWGTVCDDHWTMTEGHVVCRELGYRGASSVEIDAHHGEGEGKIWMDEVECEGSELSLLDCPHETEHDCDHYEDASVVCF